MATSSPRIRPSSGWSEHHNAFMRMSADRCTDRERFKAALMQIKDIDAFHQVGQVSASAIFLCNNDETTTATAI